MDLRTAPADSLVTDYLVADDVVDHGHPLVLGIRAQLVDDGPDDETYVRRAFEHVRDRVTHPYDVGDPRVTVRASEVAAAGVGLCYAQAHLLAALLRVHGIPAGLCYQRLADGAGGHVVHGLVALPVDGRWHRLDPRGADVEFDLVGEALRYRPDVTLGERDVTGVRAVPAPDVLAPLWSADDVLRARLATDVADRPSGS